MKKIFLLLILGLVFSCVEKNNTPPEPFGPVPTEAQMTWHELEMSAFIHFTINTFTDKEWGFGDESPKLFNPTELNVDQWVSTLKETGFKAVILTCKHHDGFCLWPSAYTEHSVKNSPIQGGKADIVKDVSDACKKYGLKFGVYLSPWDRNYAQYGTPAYLDYFRNQIKELFTNYGPVFEMWFDGANGGDGYYGGANERRRISGKTYYEWPTTIKMVREMAPDVIFFSDAGPGVRWTGNESGIGGVTNWNTINIDTLYAGQSGITGLLNVGEEDGKSWVPAEVNNSIRPGWFYHEREDSRVKSPERLFEIYLTSVGRGSTWLLNIPPDRRGLFHEKDVASLKGLKTILDKTFAVDLAAGAKVKASETRGKAFAASKVVDGKKDTYWATNDGTTTGTLELDLGSEKTINFVQIQEYIRLGQRVRSCTVEVWKNDAWQEVAKATTIGYKRILKIDPVSTSKVRISITDARACPVISAVSLY